MSLLDDNMENCILMVQQVVPDGYGGYKNIWTEGTPFKGAFELLNSVQDKIAQKLGVKEDYQIYTRKVFTLNANDYVKRVSDGLYFHVTSNGKDAETPNGAELDLRVVDAKSLTVLPR